LSGTGAIGGEWSFFNVTNAACLTVGGSGSNLTNYCRFESGSASAISISQTLIMTNCAVFSTNTNALTGAGTLNVASLSFYGAGHSTGINVTTQVPTQFVVGAFQAVNPAGDYTVLNSDYYVGATTSAARAITLPASPIIGETHRVKDITGTGAANNITISGNGHNIDGAASFVINTNYGSVDVYYNGTNWFIV